MHLLNFIVSKKITLSVLAVIVLIFTSVYGVRQIEQKATANISKHPATSATTKRTDNAKTTNATVQDLNSATAAKGTFKIAVLPDTQSELNRPDMPHVSGQSGQGFYDQVQWIKKYAKRLNIVAIVGVGDIVGNSECQDQWDSAKKTYGELLATGLPVLIGTGNHDVIRYKAANLPSGCKQISNDSRAPHAPGTGSPNDNQWVKSLDFDHNFPISEFRSRSYFGGSMAGSESASYDLFSASGVNFLAITLPFGPTASQLKWAKSIAAKYPTRHVIFATHDYLGDDNQLRGNRAHLLGYGDYASTNLESFNASRCVKNHWYTTKKKGVHYCTVEYALASHNGGTPMPGAKNGIDMYKSFISQSPNAQFVVSGHIVKPEKIGKNGLPEKRKTPNPFVLEGYLHSQTPLGTTVNQMVFNAQTAAAGGDGYMRILTMKPADDSVTVSTPLIGASTGISPKHLTKEDNTFTIANMILTKTSTHPFWDVSDKNQFVADINFIRSHGITNGYANNTFHPSGPVSRQAAAEFMFRSLKAFQSGAVKDHKSCSQGNIKNRFRDVANTSQFCYAINYMANIGIISGYKDGGFHPTAHVSRQAFAAWAAPVICLRKNLPRSTCLTAPAKTKKFSDVTRKNIFYGQIMYLRNIDITNGYRNNTFRPTTSISRQAAAAFIARIFAYAP